MPYANAGADAALTNIQCHAPTCPSPLAASASAAAPAVLCMLSPRARCSTPSKAATPPGGPLAVLPPAAAATFRPHPLRPAHPLPTLVPPLPTPAAPFPTRVPHSRRTLAPRPQATPALRCLRVTVGTVPAPGLAPLKGVRTPQCPSKGHSSSVKTTVPEERPQCLIEGPARAARRVAFHRLEASHY